MYVLQNLSPKACIKSTTKNRNTKKVYTQPQNNVIYKIIKKKMKPEKLKQHFYCRRM